MIRYLSIEKSFEVGHKVAMDAHVRGENGFVKEFTEGMRAIGGIEKKAEALLSENVHKYRIMHVFERGFVVVKFRERRSSVFLEVV